MNRFGKLLALAALAVCSLSAITMGGITIQSTTKTVATSGTAVPLSSTGTKAAWITVQALSSNTGTICIGASTVLAASKNGTCLTAGQAAPFNPIPGLGSYNMGGIYMDATVNGEGAALTYAQ